MIRLILIIVLLACPVMAPVMAQNTGRILTSQMVKNYWLNTFPRPRTLAPDFHQKKKEYEALVANIQSGALDEQAELFALNNNAAVYRAAGDHGNAALAEQQIARINNTILQRQRLAQTKRIADNLESVKLSLQLLQAQGLLGY